MIIYVTDQLGIVRIPPELSRVLSGHFPFDLKTISQLVEYDILKPHCICP